MAVRFGILGPLSVLDAGREVAISAGRDRVVLAMLLLNSRRIVGVDELVDAVWEDRPPVTARGQLQTCVSRLRRTLPAGVIRTDPAGYGISVDLAELDAAEFSGLVAAAGMAGDPGAARELLGKALALWRGSALAGIESRVVRQRAAVLDERYATVLEDRIELDLADGRDRDLVAELTGLVERFPLRERLRMQLMVTLYRVGRQADALAEYRRVHDLLRDELGIEPGRALRELHRRILTGQVKPARAVSAVPAPVRCLPRTVGDFTGRDGAVRRLLDAAGAEATGGPVVLVIDGMAGSGKTTLALHVAHRLAVSYPDGQLFLDLQGHSEHEPVEPAAALLTLLRQLDVPPDRIPPDLPGRADLWRRVLAGRRMLLLLDNAASSAQLTRLLPTSADSLCLITSRRRLVGLDGVHLESLRVLDEAEAVALLGKIAGDRVRAEPEAALEVVRRCGRLPLAIRLAGARLAHRSGWRVADLVRRLGESALPELAAEERTVASAFALSYDQLDSRHRRVFRLLGLQPAERFGALAVAALVGLPLDDAWKVLDGLVDAHLIEEPEPDVFRLHDLLRQYAAALAAELPDEERREAVVQLLDFHLYALFETNEPNHRGVAANDVALGAPMRPDLVAELTDPPAYLERERSHLVGYVDAGLAVGRPDYAWTLPRMAWRRLYHQGYIAEIDALLRRGLEVARQVGDLAAVATAANYLASASHRLGRQDEARSLLETAVELRGRLGDDMGLCAAIGNLATVSESAGRFAETITLSEQALRILRRHARRPGVMMLIALRHSAISAGWARLGRLAPALRHARLQLLAAIEASDQGGIALALLNIAIVKQLAAVRTPASCRRMLMASRRLTRDGRSPLAEARVLDTLAHLCQLEGRFGAARDLLHQAVPTLQRLGHERYEACSVSRLGDVLLAMGDTAAARECADRAVALAGGRYPYERGIALVGRAEVASAEGDVRQARRGLREARELFTRLGVPERHDTARRLAELDGGRDQLPAAAAGSG